MTRMIPSTIHSSVRSGAERRLFRAIRDCPGTDRWVCLHSLAIARHETKRRGEIDFLLLTPQGLYVLEVKGGRVRREGGVWIFTDKNDRSTRKHESPFDQASSAMFSLERDLADHLPEARVREVLFGYGVLFPDIEYSEVGADVDRAIVFDVRDRARPFVEYVNRLEVFTRSRQRSLRRGLSDRQITVLANHLRGDFDLAPGINAQLDDARTELARLTQEQYSVLDTADLEPRVLVDGPAGSGKTILAMETARRQARLGRRVLFLCYNRLLARSARVRLEREEYAGTLTVATVYGHFRGLIDKSSLATEFREVSATSDEDRLYGELFPEYAAMAAMEAVEPPYESVVIDEAQDVLTERNLEAISEAVSGGLNHGHWRIFLDANNQASVYGKLDPSVLERLRTLAPLHVLTVNCRNTTPIALQTNVVANPRRKAAARAEGPPVEFLTYAALGQRLGRLQKALDDLRSNRTSPGRISVLFPTKPESSEIRRLERLRVRRLREEDAPHLGTDELSETTWSLVSGFKGLENDVVVLVGVSDIEDDWWRGVSYVGMSRARSRLFIVIHEGCNSLRHARFEKEIQRQMSLGDAIR